MTKAAPKQETDPREVIRYCRARIESSSTTADEKEYAKSVMNFIFKNPEDVHRVHTGFMKLKTNNDCDPCFMYKCIVGEWPEYISAEVAHNLKFLYDLYVNKRVISIMDLLLSGRVVCSSN